MEIRTYNRTLSKEELIIITSWSTVADKQPEDQALCNFRYIGPKWSSELMFGMFHPAAMTTDSVTVNYPHRFTLPMGEGQFISDPKYTYWQLVVQ